MNRVLEILALFSDEQPWLRVTDVSAKIGVSDSTASRLLARLDANGFVERDGRTGFYGVGRRILSLAGVAMNHSELRRAGLEEMHRLVHTLGLGANLAVIRDDALFYVANMDGRLAPRYYTLLGRHYPLHATALGKALLAWLDAEEVERLHRPGGDGQLTRYTANTIATLGALQAELVGVRRLGYSTEVEELAMGRACVAAPIRGAGGAVIAAASISGAVQVMNLAVRENDLAGAVVDAAMRVSERLGFSSIPLPDLPIIPEHSRAGAEAGAVE
ncbi:MAG: IclR family transcriptional regulator [Chloroflexota bacterium]